jgi:TetR/AcrR family transcriptional regulator, cholesterol catabolism regulator
MTPRADVTRQKVKGSSRSAALAGNSPKGGKPSGDGRRQQIFAKALGLMEKRGFHGTSIQDVANELKFTKAAFYFHVQSKEELLYEISLRTLRVMLQRVTAIAELKESPSQKMRSVIDCYVRHMVDEPALFIVYFREKAFLSPEHRATANRMERNILRALEEIYREGVRQGQFRNSDPAVSVLGILGMCFWIYNWYRKRGPLSAENISHVFQGLALSGIVTRTEGDPT